MGSFNSNKEDKLLNTVDETIISVCEKVQHEPMTEGGYVYTVAALTELLKVRAELQGRG